MPPAGQHLSSRSSLFSHRLPTFYACYLLKSIQTPLSKATYIGSTPSPPRRIRQHNGEIAQGALKTKHKRPWVMQMVVHGFPSRLAALQFEWAWQHPYKSRHLRYLRDPAGKALIDDAKKSKNIKANIQIVRLMLASHPYSNWPLHVKLFTDEAVKAWNDAIESPSASPLPLGLTYSVELEGVDGNSGQRGSGRRGPIDVKDEQFTSIYLAKNTSLLATASRLKCSVCDQVLASYATDPLTTMLCPTRDCTSVSHLACLSKRFLAREIAPISLIPRGGECTSCRTYVLWGDIVRGCYRRLAVDEEEGIADNEGEMYDSDGHDGNPSALVVSSGGTLATKKAVPADQSTEGEYFDLNVSSSGESNSPRKRGRPRKVPPGSIGSQHLLVDPPIPRPRGRPPKVAIVNMNPTERSSATTQKYPRPLSRLDSDSSGEHFDFDGITDSSDEPHRKTTQHKDPTPQSIESFAPLLRYDKDCLKSQSDTWQSPDNPMSKMTQDMSSLTVASSRKPSRKPIAQYVEISD